MCAKHSLYHSTFSFVETSRISCEFSRTYQIFSALTYYAMMSSRTMADHVEYSSSSQAHSMARNSQYSTQSWVNSNLRTSSMPPPQPVNLPTPVQPLRPLPNPHRASSTNAPHALRVVNNTPAPPTAEVNLMLRRNVSDSETATSASPRPRPRKKSFVGGFVKGIRKLPRAMFGYGAGIGGKNRRDDTAAFAMDGTSASIADSTGNTLPDYNSNPSSPAIAVGPGRSGLQKQFIPKMVNMQPTIPESPPPDVVRLDSQRDSGNPSLRVTPPSGDYGDNANLYEETRLPQHRTSGHYENPADRTTVMLFETQPRPSEYNRLVHTPIPQQRTPSPGLSYVSSEPLAPPRPTSYHSTHTAIRIPPPADTASDDPTDPEVTPRPAYASPAPRRVTSHSVLAGAPPISSSAPHSQIQTPPPHQMVQATDPGGPPAEAIGSPMSVRPEPTKDYRKMSPLSSPSPTSRDTVTTATSFYDPSFTSLNRVERFFKTLYNMPWVSHNRVTVDYLPGEGASKRRRRRNKPMSSWYHSMFQNTSRRSSVSLDLLSSGTGTGTSPNASLRASIALALGSPLSRSRHRRHSSEKPKESRHQSRRQQASRRNQGRHHDSRKRERRTMTSMATSTNTNADVQHEATKHASSPLIPTVYPFQYPPYPYPAFSAFPVPAPAPVRVDVGHPSDRPEKSPRGSRRKGHQQHKQPMMYASPPGYPPYQPLVGAPQVFLLSPASPMQVGGGLPAALVPGGVHDGHVHAAQPIGQQQVQRQPTPAGQVGTQNIPGAF